MPNFGPTRSCCFCMSEVLQGLLHQPIYGEASDCRCAHQRIVHTCAVPVFCFSDAWLMSIPTIQIFKDPAKVLKGRNSCRVFEMFYQLSTGALSSLAMARFLLRDHYWLGYVTGCLPLMNCFQALSSMIYLGAAVECNNGSCRDVGAPWLDFQMYRSCRCS